MTEETKLIMEELAKINVNLEGVNNQVGTLNTQVNDMGVQMEKMNTRMDKLDTQMVKVKKQVKEVRLTLENEIRHNISIVAEGHLDLSRKLDEALKVENEKEMLLVRVNRLETEVRRIKERIGDIA